MITRHFSKESRFEGMLERRRGNSPFTCARSWTICLSICLDILTSFTWSRFDSATTTCATGLFSLSEDTAMP